MRPAWVARQVALVGLLCLVVYLMFSYTAGPSPPERFLRDTDPLLPKVGNSKKAGRPVLKSYPPVSLKLTLPDSVVNSPVLRNKNSMFQAYGFNLSHSNSMPLDRPLPDMRMEECQVKQYPKEMPTVSVIIIFYNEPVSTLLRNVVSVLNRSPPELLGEIVLINDNSTLDELKYLPDNLALLPKNIPPVRLVQRNTHNGIVGARIRGAEEAVHDIIVFLDSHSEVLPGWLEPLVARIHEDRTRVVVPQIRGLELNKLGVTPGDMWPPAKGSFNWRLSFTIIEADIDRDVVGPVKKAAAVRSPVMPGGLFAMDRKFFFEIGAYDPEILYYGAEHVELSFRVWMCGGSIEWVPCSNVGHIYRNFNRFAADPQLANVDIGRILDRNDQRVAEVWMDEYKDLFYKHRKLRGRDFGDVSDRVNLRKKLKCHSFKWFLDTVHPDLYVPDITPKLSGRVSDPLRNECLDNQNRPAGEVSIAKCTGSAYQLFHLTHQGSIQTQTHINHFLKCLHMTTASQVPCSHEDAPSWIFVDGKFKTKANLNSCLERTPQGDLHIRPCQSGKSSQNWIYEGATSGSPSTIMASDRTRCVDNMQRREGAAGLYSCHGYAVQQWYFRSDGKLANQFNKETCLGGFPIVSQGTCLAKTKESLWNFDGTTIRPQLRPELCLDRTGSKQGQASLQTCSGRASQEWKIGDF